MKTAIVSLIRPIKEYLFKQNLEVITWLDQQGPIRSWNTTARTSESVTRPWFTSAAATNRGSARISKTSQKAYGYGREGDWLANAVYVGAPPSDQKEDFLTHLVPHVIRNFSSFDP